MKLSDPDARALLERLARLPPVTDEVESGRQEREVRLSGVLGGFIDRLEGLRDPSAPGEFSSHRRFVGKAITAGKRSLLSAVRPLIIESLRRQAAFNQELLSALRAVDLHLGRGDAADVATLAKALNARLDTIDRRLDALESAKGSKPRG